MMKPARGADVYEVEGMEGTELTVRRCPKKGFRFRSFGVFVSTGDFTDQVCVIDRKENSSQCRLRFGFHKATILRYGKSLSFMSPAWSTPPVLLRAFDASLHRTF